MAPKQGLTGFISNLYYDPYKWSVVKSIGIFLLGVRIANECVGLELLPQGPSVSSFPAIV